MPAGSVTAKGFPLPNCSSPGTMWVGQQLWMCCACIGAVDQQDSSEPVKGLPNICLEKVSAKNLEARRMNFWTEILNPFLACPWCLWLLKNWSPQGTLSFTNNLPACMNAYRLHIPIHIAGLHKPALLEEPHCHWQKYLCVSTQHLTNKTCTQSAQSLDWDFPTLPAFKY